MRDSDPLSSAPGARPGDSLLRPARKRQDRGRSSDSQQLESPQHPSTVGDATLCDSFEDGGGGSAGVSAEEDESQVFNEQELTLSAQQLEAIRMIALGRSVVATAAALGVHRATIYRWRREETFAAVLRRRQEELYLSAVGRLRATLVKAVQEVEQDLRQGHPDDRLRTAFRLLPYVGSPKLRPAGLNAEAGTQRVPGPSPTDNL